MYLGRLPPDPQPTDSLGILPLISSPVAISRTCIITSQGPIFYYNITIYKCNNLGPPGGGHICPPYIFRVWFGLGFQIFLEITCLGMIYQIQKDSWSLDDQNPPRKSLARFLAKICTANNEGDKATALADLICKLCFRRKFSHPPVVSYRCPLARTQQQVRLPVPFSWSFRPHSNRTYGTSWEYIGEYHRHINDFCFPALPIQFFRFCSV